MKGFILLKAVLLSVLAVWFSACSMDCLQKERDENDEAVTLKVTSWNVETFFDSQNDGSEYSEFVKSKSWGRDAYMERLKRLCSVIKLLDSDVFVLEEIENEAVLQDVANFLAGEWNQNKLYSYACFVKGEGGSIGCGVLSRYPLGGLRVHGLDVKGVYSYPLMPSMRPLMRLTVSKNQKELVLLVNHWKSMSGGKEETESWRDWQEAVLAQNVLDETGLKNPLLAAGDFNRDVKEFVRGKEEGSVLMRSKFGSLAELSSPWFRSDGSLVEPGSYWFSKEWSRIDNFFLAGGAKAVYFNVETEGPWCSTEDSIPYKYEIWNGEGYSDHLPITCMVSF